MTPDEFSSSPMNEFVTDWPKSHPIINNKEWAALLIFSIVSVIPGLLAFIFDVNAHTVGLSILILNLLFLPIEIVCILYLILKRVKK